MPIEKSHCEGMAESVGRQSYDSRFQADLAKKSAHPSPMLTRTTMMSKEKIICPLPAAALPCLKKFNAACR